MSHIFGPVPSRRLGRSLGVDLVPFKTCSYDCIYCQLGPTTCKTVERREWVPLDAVLAELADKLATRPDYITLSGSGEPTLFSRLGELIGSIRAMTDVPVAVLTNGSLLWQPEVRRQLAEAHLVIPSLDAGSAGMFKAVNRPHESIVFDRMLEGLIDLRREYHGACWLEVFLLAGHTAVDSEVDRIVECVRRIRPDRVQLNTATRPTAEDCAARVDRERMAELAGRFDPPAEVIADYRGVHARSDFQAGRQSVLEMIRRRPCSLDDIAAGLNMHRNEAVIRSIVSALASGGRSAAVHTRGQTTSSSPGRPAARPSIRTQKWNVCDPDRSLIRRHRTRSPPGRSIPQLDASKKSARASIPRCP
ncbi:MAG: radical SAM protein [Planctomycetes bacterium]|nr:radical SAM protein [Planctomycetota bacterium]